MKRGVLAAAALALCAATAWAQPGVEATNPTALGQYQNNFSLSVGGSPTYTETLSGTSVAQAGTAWSTTVVLKAVVHGADSTIGLTPYAHRVRVEVRPIDQPLLGIYTHEGNLTDFNPEAGVNFSDPATGDGTGRTSFVTVTGLAPGVSYHWQAQSWKT
jgi:hypothetical protein